MADLLDLGVLSEFATALLIGVLVGVEREKRKLEEGDQGIAGLRTFILVALIGAVAGYLAEVAALPWLVVAAVVAVAGPVIAGYVTLARIRPDSLGLTTELAAIAVCLLGAMTMLGHRELAIGLGVVIAAVLAYKQPLHGLVAKLGWDDVYAGVRLLIASFIVLPLLPDRPLDPWEALNPYKLWLLVILISSLSLVGYVATRWLGSGRGTVLTGITGGLVSSTAVTLSFAKRGRDEPQAAAALACGILIAWAVMFGRILGLVLAVNRELLWPLLPPMLAMGAVALVGCWLLYRHSGKAEGKEDVPLRNPFSLTAAVKFGLLFAAVLLLVKVAQLYLPDGGVYILAALAGLTDVDAITLSMADYARSNPTSVAALAVVIAAVSNTLVKCAMVTSLGGPALRRPVLLATIAITLAGAAGAAVTWLG
ncbi:MAG: MgtC/SapB family protein [Geminicoccaceae bacterium]